MRPVSTRSFWNSSGSILSAAATSSADAAPGFTKSLAWNVTSSCAPPMATSSVCPSASTNGPMPVDKRAGAATIAQLLAAAAAEDRQTVICASHDPQVIAHADEVLSLGE